jgi:hypothetical protein
MVIAKLAFFQVQVERVFTDASELGQPSFRHTPEAFDIVDGVVSCSKLVFAMLNAMVFIVTDIDHTVVALETIGIDDVLRTHLASDNCLQCGFGAIIRHDLSVDSTVALDQTEYHGFVISASPPVPITRRTPNLVMILRQLYLYSAEILWP